MSQDVLLFLSQYNTHVFIKKIQRFNSVLKKGQPRSVGCTNVFT